MANTIALSELMLGLTDFIEAPALDCIADAGSDATKIVDSALSIYGDGYFDDYFAYVTSGLANGDIRQIETFDKATTTLDPYVDFSAAVAAADTYELHKHDPNQIKRSIQDAIDSIYPKLYKLIVFESLGKDTLASNATQGQKNVVVNDATRFFASQVVTLEDDDGDTEDCTIASIDTTTNTLTMQDNLTYSYETAKNAKITAKSGKYFNVGATVGYNRITNVYLKDSATAKRYVYTGCKVIQSASGERQLYFPKAISVDSDVWVVECRGKLEEVSSSSDTITLETRRVKLLYAEAAYHFYERQANDVSAGDWERLKALALQYRRKVFEDFRELWMPQPVEYADLSTDGDIRSSAVSQDTVIWSP